MLVTKNSIGVFTSPQANVDEKYAGSTSGPSINLEGNPVQKNKNLITAR
jgi:hypothetical protein